MANLLPAHWRDEIERWMQQDMPKWDIGGFVVGDAPHRAMLLGKSEGVLAGVPFANFVFDYAGCAVDRACAHSVTAVSRQRKVF